jgi:hypothetical protein
MVRALLQRRGTMGIHEQSAVHVVVVQLPRRAWQRAHVSTWATSGGVVRLALPVSGSITQAASSRSLSRRTRPWTAPPASVGSPALAHAHAVSRGGGTPAGDIEFRPRRLIPVAVQSIMLLRLVEWRPHTGSSKSGRYPSSEADCGCQRLLRVEVKPALPAGFAPGYPRRCQYLIAPAGNAMRYCWSDVTPKV